MPGLTLTDILDDLRAADVALRRFEQRYWLSSEVFYQVYSQGLLDDGSHAEDFAEWAGHYQLKLKREEALTKLSRQLGPGGLCLIHSPTTLSTVPSVRGRRQTAPSLHPGGFRQ